MSEDESDAKVYIRFFCIMLLLISLVGAFYAGNTQGSESELLEEYQNGFVQCNSLCEEDGKRGYIHAFDDFYHKCFCFGNNTMEVSNE